MQTARDWTYEKRKLAVGRIIAHLMSSRQISRKDAVQMLSERTGVPPNTIHGWVSKGISRVPPAWGLIDLLRIESGMVKMTPLKLPSKKTPPLPPKPTPMEKPAPTEKRAPTKKPAAKPRKAAAKRLKKPA